MICRIFPTIGGVVAGRDASSLFFSGFCHVFNTIAAVDKEGSDGAHETLWVLDVWPMPGFFKRVNAASWEVLCDE